MKSKLTKVSFYVAIVEVALLLIMLFGAGIGNNLPVDSLLIKIVVIALLLFLVLLPIGSVVSIIAFVYAFRSGEKKDVTYSIIAFAIFLLILIFLFVYVTYFFRPFMI